MKYLSLFSGIGGFELGIQQAYEDNNRGLLQGKTTKNIQQDSTNTKSRQDGITCIGYSEIDKYAIQIFEKQFKNIKNYGDITKINAKELPDFDLLVGGFPCQSFSIAGKRGGFSDTRGTLFFDIARIIREKQPRLLLLENVKGLLSHDKGRTFYTIISTLDELGYDTQWQVLNSKNFGVPQNRERVFIIGHLRGTSRPEVFPFKESNTETNQPHLVDSWGETKVATAIDANYHKGHGQRGKSRGRTLVQLNKPKHSNDRVYSEEGLSPTLNTAQGGNRQPFVAPVLSPDRPNKRQNGRRFKEDGEPSFTLTGQDRHGVMIGEATKKGYAVAKEGDSINLSVPNSKTRRGRVGKGVAQTLDTGMQQHTLQNAKIRRLTPTECERLQGFPDGWTEGLSDTQRYKTLGNAVTVNVIKAIMEKLI